MPSKPNVEYPSEQALRRRGRRDEALIAQLQAQIENINGVLTRLSEPSPAERRDRLIAELANPHAVSRTKAEIARLLGCSASVVSKVIGTRKRAGAPPVEIAEERAATAIGMPVEDPAAIAAARARLVRAIAGIGNGRGLHDDPPRTEILTFAQLRAALEQKPAGSGA